MPKLNPIHWILMFAVTCLTTLCHWKHLDTHFGWPFVYALDQWDVSNYAFLPFDAFRLFPFLGDVVIGAAVGLSLAEIARRTMQIFSKK